MLNKTRQAVFVPVSGARPTRRRATPPQPPADHSCPLGASSDRDTPDRQSGQPSRGIRPPEPSSDRPGACLCRSGDTSRGSPARSPPAFDRSRQSRAGALSAPGRGVLASPDPRTVLPSPQNPQPALPNLICRSTNTIAEPFVPNNHTDRRSHGPNSRNRSRENARGRVNPGDGRDGDGPGMGGGSFRASPQPARRTILREHGRMHGQRLGRAGKTNAFNGRRPTRSRTGAIGQQNSIAGQARSAASLPRGGQERVRRGQTALSTSRASRRHDGLRS